MLRTVFKFFRSSDLEEVIDCPVLNDCGPTKVKGEPKHRLEVQENILTGK